jgi:ribosome-associated protein
VTAIATASTSPRETALQHALQCARAGADNKGKDVVVLDMHEITPLYDYFVLITATSRKQAHTIAEEVDAQMATLGERRLGIEGYEAARWVVQDYGDIVIHVFDPQTRDYYGLADLWADAKQLDWERYV